MESDALGLAFAAGLVAALNPCGFAMLPAYLALVVRGEDSSRTLAVGRALTATAAMALGFIAVFGLFGLLTTSAANALQGHLPYVTLAVGIALAAAGGWLLAGREMPSPARNSLGDNSRWAPTARLGSMFGYGIGYALASLSCTLAVASALASSALVDRLRQVMPYVNRISGAILLLVGAYVGYYGWYELQLFSATGASRDPVIAAAARLQGTLAGWVFTHGPWPWLIALTAMVLVALGWTGWRRQRVRR